MQDLVDNLYGTVGLVYFTFYGFSWGSWHEWSTLSENTITSLCSPDQQQARSQDLSLGMSNPECERKVLWKGKQKEKEKWFLSPIRGTQADGHDTVRRRWLEVVPERFILTYKRSKEQLYCSAWSWLLPTTVCEGREESSAEDYCLRKESMGCWWQNEC